MEPDKDGNTLLHHAAKHLPANIIKQLISDGIDVNMKNKAGETALDIAERYNNQDAAIELMRHGAKSKTHKG